MWRHCKVSTRRLSCLWKRWLQRECPTPKKSNFSLVKKSQILKSHYYSGQVYLSIFFSENKMRTPPLGQTFSKITLYGRPFFLINLKIPPTQKKPKIRNPTKIKNPLQIMVNFLHFLRKSFRLFLFLLYFRIFLAAVDLEEPPTIVEG